MMGYRLQLLIISAVVVLWVNVIASIYLDSRIHADWSRMTSSLANLNRPHGYDHRFASLRQALPYRGTVGYISPLVNEAIFDDIQESGAYYQTQYALVPLVVDNAWSHELVIGNFGGIEDALARVAMISGVKKVEDFGHGVVLITREK